MDNAYDGLLDEGDSSQWAFGTSFEDPLAGVDTSVPDGVDAGELATYCLALGDDALVLSHRLAEWCSRAPELEEDIALANTALDLLGQARLLLARAAAADPALVPALPDGSPVPAEDALAFFRDAGQFRNVRLAEVPNGDFAHVVVRILLFSTARLALFDRLRSSPDQVLAAVAAKGVKELTYHRDWSARWFRTLALGTAESRRRLVTALDALWPLYPELLTGHPSDLDAEVDAVLDHVFTVSEVERPQRPALAGVGGRAGRDGLHTEALSRMLAEMQVVARAHPMGRW
ncbi:1,2-phenylacetyl-CoA epoxidase subunit PaaC [Cryptosporangium aurantiacum]|uniref:Ring-1,2-phenylacetyl-CoA epoxidase subunit PaaC n=1 Tax=Cryptosporangium aurantiacum TaxID=134849 RepID=A0A1M7RN32_9ACTN|nr:1,2-phenylacetyl-CoA epoxidase subunit PaaC [Cryptosporangium aurantiacum]SHN47735.1 ring-1,2-phenylacetyl-CoA epoxidase subunit PaaC [Cryptosporangium aurantiacum]